MCLIRRVAWVAALSCACASEPEVPAPRFEVVPVGAARDQAGAVVVSIAMPWYRYQTSSPTLPERQPAMAVGGRVQLATVQVLISNIRLGRVATDAGGSRVVTSIVRDPRTFRVEWDNEVGGVTLPLTAFALAPGAPPSAWDETYTLSFDVGRTPGEEPIPVTGRGGRVSYAYGGTHTLDLSGEGSERGVFGGLLTLDAPASYVDCLNPSDGVGARGVRLRRDAATRAEITFHVDHLFWTALGVEGQRAVPEILGLTPASPDVPSNAWGIDLHTRLERVAVGDVTIFGAPLSLNGARGVRTLLDFVTEGARTAMHLNGDGRCAVLPRAAP